LRLLYVPELQEGGFELPEDEARHAIKVLRARVGDTFKLIDGKGASADAEITVVGKRNCIVKIDEVLQTAPPSPSLTMIVSPTKQTERFEWFLEKAVEIGVDRVIPVWSTRSERKVEKYERWLKVIVSAMKQSGRSWLPVLERACSFEEAIALIDTPVLIAHCMESEKVHLLNVVNPGEDACIAIGPEGDFTEEEIGYVLEKGGVEISLGESRLRTETAAIVATAYFRALQK
jgi:16S rRNA (uracil1498-N3)-methyltransferase